jgi:cell division protein FtsA
LSEYVDDAGFATVVGLLQYGKVQSDNKKSSTQKTGESLFHRVQSWFKGEF